MEVHELKGLIAEGRAEGDSATLSSCLEQRAEILKVGRADTAGCIPAHGGTEAVRAAQPGGLTARVVACTQQPFDKTQTR